MTMRRTFTLSFIVAAGTILILLSLSSGVAVAGNWVQESAAGFNSTANAEIWCQAVYGSYIYMGTVNATGCQVWRSDGSNWTQVVGQGVAGTPTGPGFGNPANTYAVSMAVYGSYLYAGTFNAGGGQLWRYDGFNWTPAVGGTAPVGAGFGNPNNTAITNMIVYGPYLYAATNNNAAGCQVWRFDGANWTQMVGQGGAGTPTGPGFGNPTNTNATTMAVFSAYLYVGTLSQGGAPACEVWRFDGANWTPVVAAGAAIDRGFGKPNNDYAWCMMVYGSRLYVGTHNVGGCQVWSYDGASWSQVVGQDALGTPGTGPGFGSANNVSARSMGVFDSRIYFGTSNNGGCEVWSVKSATTWYLAEGATTGGFETWILVQNPNTAPVPVALTFQTGSGEAPGPTDTIPAHSRRSYLANSYVSSFDVSTKVTSGGGDIICERSMYWTPDKATTRVLGHDSIGVIQPAMRWYLAEGVTKGGYETWVLVQNPNPQPVGIDVKFQTKTGQIQGPVDTIPARSRKSYPLDSWVDTFDVSTMITSTTPGESIICERAVYWTPDGSNTHRQVGTDSIGVAEPSSTWYLAEGASHGGYETFILVQNPNSTDVNVNIKYQTTNGEVQGPVDTVFANSRKTYRVNDKVSDYNVSTAVSSFGGEIICERSVYWTPPGSDQKILGHDSIGVRTGDLNWYLAEGATSGGFETWVLVQNPNAAPVGITINFQTGTGEIAGPTDTIPPNSRRSYKVNDWTDSYDVSTKVASNGGLIICERAVYWTPPGVNIKVLGTDSIGFNL